MDHSWEWKDSNRLKTKAVVLLGDFHADLLKYDQNSNIPDFLDLMYYFLLLPHIFGPTRTTTTSATLIDNIFTNNYNSCFVSENFVNTLSHNHVQFLVMGNQHSSLEFDSTKQMLRDFQEIEKNKNIISSLLENVNWVTEQWCRFILWTISLKVEKLINFWAPL